MNSEELLALARSSRDELLAENNRVYNILEDDLGEHQGFHQNHLINELYGLTERIMNNAMKARLTLYPHITPEDDGQ